MTLRDEIETILKPVFDVRAPYAVQMIDRIVLAIDSAGPKRSHEQIEALAEIGLRVEALRVESRIDAAKERSSESVVIGLLLAGAIVRNMRTAADELDRYRQWVADLQSGMYVNCVYCGHSYGPSETTPVSMADALKAHVAVCPQHPMSALLAIAKRWAAIDGGSWHVERHARERSELMADTLAAIAKVTP